MKRKLGRIATLPALVVAAWASGASATPLDALISGGGTITQGAVVFGGFAANLLGAGIGPSNVDVAGITSPSGAPGLRFTAVPAGSFSQSITGGGGGGSREIIVGVSFTATVGGASYRIHGVQQALDPSAAAHNNAVIYSLTTVPPSGTPVASLSSCLAGAGFPSGSGCGTSASGSVLSSDASTLFVYRQIQIVVGQKGGAATGDASAAFFDSTFTLVGGPPPPPPAAAEDELVPVVVKVGGVGYSSELAVTNTGPTPLELSLRYTSAIAGPPAGVSSGAVPAVPLVVRAGEQVLLPDVLAWLRDRGAAGGADDVGSLHLTAPGAQGAASARFLRVSARTTSPSGAGRAGVGYGAVSTADLASASVVVYGLRQSGTDRSNLAIVNAGSDVATYRLTLVSGDPFDPRSVVLAPDLALAPGEWRQLDRVLSLAGMRSGWAMIDRVEGSAPFVAYGVINDAGTNDGSYVSMAPPGGWAEPLVIPAAVETALFSTELTLSNTGARPVTATISYVESLAGAGGPAVTTAVSLLPGEQRVVPDAIDFLRLNSGGIGPRGESRAGAMTVSFLGDAGPVAGWAGARVTTPGDGGRYGVSYPGVPLSAAATTEALVTGLRQDASNRSNLALVNTGDAGEPIVVKYEAWNGSSGTKVGESQPETLAPGAWWQVNRVLEPFGIANGWIRVLKLSGSSKFVAYGVVNDGGTVQPGTNDGSYVAMTGVK